MISAYSRGLLCDRLEFIVVQVGIDGIYCDEHFHEVEQVSNIVGPADAWLGCCLMAAQGHAWLAGLAPETGPDLTLERWSNSQN